MFIKKDHFKTQFKLEDSNRTKNKLLSILAHDIRSPLSNLRALLSLDKKGVLKEEDFQKHKETVNRKIEFLTSEIDDVVEWSVVQSENLEPKIANFNVEDCIRKVLAIFSDFCKEKSITIHLESKVEEISMDENHFKLIIRNLLHNAIKFTPENGLIKISTNKLQKEAIIEICDNGIGMSSELVEVLKSQEKTVSLNGTQGEKGTGLGLTMCLDLIERNKLKLDIQSKLNVGSTFSLSIPAQ